MGARTGSARGAKGIPTTYLENRGGLGPQRLVAVIHRFKTPGWRHVNDMTRNEVPET